MPDSNQHIFPAAGVLTTQQIRSAQRVVACIATDTDECRQLLDMLGLLPHHEGGTDG